MPEAATAEDTLTIFKTMETTNHGTSGTFSESGTLTENMFRVCLVCRPWFLADLEIGYRHKTSR